MVARFVQPTKYYPCEIEKKFDGYNLSFPTEIYI